MVRSTVLAALLVLAAAVGRAENPPTPAALPSILKYVPDDAVFALRLRAPQLAASGLWKKATAADASAFRKFMTFTPVTVDPEKDVADVVFAVGLRFEGAEIKDFFGGAAMQLVRDVDPKKVFKKRLSETTVKGVAGPAYEVWRDVLVMFPNARTMLAGSPEYLAKVAGAGVGPRETPAAAFWKEALGRTGEVVVAARMTDGVRQYLQALIEEGRRSLPEGSRDREVANKFIGTDLSLRLGLEMQTGVLAVDLSRPADAVQLVLVMASQNAAAFVGSGLTMLEPSLAALQPPAGLEIPAPPQEPLYRATYQGREVRVATSRAMLDWLATASASDDVKAEMRSRAAASLKALSQIAKAWRKHMADSRGDPARRFADLTAYLGNKPEALHNPVLREHAADGDYELVALPQEGQIVNPGATVLAFERYVEPALMPPAGIGAAFADGHSERVPVEIFEQLLAETRKLAGRSRP